MDIGTLAVYNAWVTVVLTIGFTAVAIARRKSEHVLWWTAGNAARAAGSLILAFNIATGDIVTVLTANTLLLASSGLYLTSFERLTGNRGMMPPAIAIIAGTFGVVLTFTVIQPDLKARIVGYSVGSSLLLLQCAVVAIRHAGRGNTRSSLRAAGAVFGVFGLITLLRGLATLAGPGFDTVLSSPPVQAAFLVLAGMFYVGSNFAMLWSIIVGDGERHAAELDAARQAAERASLAKSRFLATMSHELRTPLNGVLGAAQLLLDDPSLAPEPRRRVQMITSAGRHLLGVVNDVLDFSKIEAGKLSLQPRDGVDLRGLLGVATDVIAPQATAKGLLLMTDAAPDLPRAVRVDGMRLQQVLLNLLSNAVKFTHDGRVVLRVRRLDDGRLRFEVQDDGPGIPAGKRDLLFKDFSQIEDGASESSGTGLGLAISSRLVRAMGGRLSLDATVSRGALFRFDIPLPETAPAAAGPMPAHAAAEADPAAAAAPAPRIRVLIADDVEMNREVLAAMLKRLGCAVDKAEDGAEALAMAARGGLDLVLMDMRMPVMDGLDATRAIRGLNDPSAARVPIVALTANAFEEAIDQCRAAGMDDYLAKPIQIAELAEVLRRHTSFVEQTSQGQDGATIEAAALSGMSGDGAAPIAGADDEMQAIDRLQRMLGRDRVSQMLDSFMSTAAERLQRMTPAADPAVLADDARTLAGMASLLGLEQAALLGRRLATSTENGEDAAIRQAHLDAFGSRLRSTLVELMMRRARLREQVMP